MSLANAACSDVRTFVRGTKASSAEIAHRPCTRPKPRHGVAARQLYARLDIPAREAELIPRLDHGASVVEIMIPLLRDCEHQRPVGGRHRIGVVPFAVDVRQ